MVAELGDYDRNEHTVDFFRDFYLFPENLVQDQDEKQHQENIDTLIVKTIQKYKTLVSIAANEAEHKYVEYCLLLTGYGEEALPARNVDEELCHVGSSCYGIIVHSGSNENSKKFSYKWENVLTISAHRSTLNLKIVTDNQTESLQYSMEDSEFTKYAAKMLCNRKTFYDKNQDATNRNFERNELEIIPPMVRRPTLRKGQEIFIVPDNNVRHSHPDSPIPDSSQSMESLQDYHKGTNGTPRNYIGPQRQTASFRYFIIIIITT